MGVPRRPLPAFGICGEKGRAIVDMRPLPPPASDACAAVSPRRRMRPCRARRPGTSCRPRGIPNNYSRTLLPPSVSYTEEKLRQIWEKADTPPPNWDKSEWRLDAFHALIKWSKYGRREEYGWEVDRIVPPRRGGGDDMSNLRPMHWLNHGVEDGW